MAIAEMAKLRLVGIAGEQDRLLDALQRTGAVQIVEGAAAESESRAAGGAAAAAKRAVAAAELLGERARALKADVEPVEEITYREFSGIGADAEVMEELIDAIESANARRAACLSARTRLEGLAAALAPYLGFGDSFADYRDTRHTAVRLGTVAPEALRELLRRAEALVLTVTAVSETSTTAAAAVCAVCHVSQSAALDALLGEFSFTNCPFDEPLTPAEKNAELAGALRENATEAQRIAADIDRLIPELRRIRVYADYLGYLAEKERARDEFSRTRTTFACTAFVPRACVERVGAAIREATDAAWFEFTEPEEGDAPPTLLANNGVVRNFEFVTNLYSPPKYRELDPNFVMGVFFMLFFGFIMADIGYGILLGAIGLFAGLRMRKTNGSRSLVLLIGMGGIFALAWGLLFGSFFGVDLGFGVLPNAEQNPATLLVYCLAVGVLQLLVGYLLKGVQALRTGSWFDAVADGWMWAVFSLGILLVVPELGVGMFNAGIGFDPPKSLLYAGLGIAGAALLFEIVFAGRHAKGFGKVTKGFGAAYGTINFMSDVLSYARLFGLMLSGTIVARIVSELSVGMMTGVGGVIGGTLILVIGHAFNLAIGVLGAYIHDSRLQYIEFFSRFYEGEGELFRPLGSRFNYITITK